MKNQDIRQAAKESNIKLWQIADRFHPIGRKTEVVIPTGNQSIIQSQTGVSNYYMRLRQSIFISSSYTLDVFIRGYSSCLFKIAEKGSARTKTTQFS